MEGVPVRQSDTEEGVAWSRGRAKKNAFSERQRRSGPGMQGKPGARNGTNSHKENSAKDEVPVYLSGGGKGRGWGRGWAKKNISPEREVRPGLGMQSNPALKDDMNSLKEDSAKASSRLRFAEVSNQIQNNVQHHLQNLDNFSEEDDDDDEGIEDKVIQSIFKTYSVNYDQNDVTDIDKAQGHMLHSFRSSTAACLICIENVKREDAIWSCSGCYCIFHIQCIQKWVREGVYQSTYKTDNQSSVMDIPWFCPKCRFQYKQSDCPTKYYCFCGKESDPRFDPWLVPHSCGQPCGRRLKPDCGHNCLLLCHPGPCPPCPKMVKSTCYCGRQLPQVRRCSAQSWSCGQVCSKQLSCGQHTCEQPCHKDNCPPCSKSSRQKCLCGRASAILPCASAQWQCEEVCGKALSCGFHVCEEVCHFGKCGPCPRSGPRQCPCGKTEFTLPCTEDIPTCGDTCHKLLSCGVHNCTQRCHTGPCGPCLQVTVKTCRCGQRKKEVPCSKEYLCDIKCVNLRNCGKHQCKRKCCDGNCPPCEQICGKTLSCKNHKCASGCHRGPCYPCPLTVTITCFCQISKIAVPCGREKVTKPPRCTHLCKIPPNCHHAQREPHRCHFGDCPACRQVCTLPLPNCQHKCPKMCHDAVKIKVRDKAPRAGPWEGRPVTRTEVVQQSCPQCEVPISTWCKGRHEQRDLACSAVAPYSCGQMCGRKLLCGNHSCSFECHQVQNARDDKTAGENCQVCEKPCEMPRPLGCTHKCLEPCHLGSCPPCKTMIRMRCHCQASLKHVPCHEWVAATGQQQNLMKSCGGPCPRMLPCSHPCKLTCHHGDCTRPEDCDRRVVLRCKCRRKKKDSVCSAVTKDEEKCKLPCDDTCRKLQEEKRKNVTAAEQAKREEEEQKQKAELEEFERKMKGRKKKPRKHQQEVVEVGFWKQHQWKVVLGIGVLVMLLFIGYLLTRS